MNGRKKTNCLFSPLPFFPPKKHVAAFQQQFHWFSPPALPYLPYLSSCAAWVVGCLIPQKQHFRKTAQQNILTEINFHPPPSSCETQKGKSRALALFCSPAPIRVKNMSTAFQRGWSFSHIHTEQSPSIPFFSIPIRYWYFQGLKIRYWYYTDTFQDLELRYRYYTDTFIVWSFDTDTILIPNIKCLIPRVIP